MQMDLYFFILSTCMHLMSGAKFSDSSYELTKQCQSQLTTCHSKIRSLNAPLSDKEIVNYCSELKNK